MPPIESTIDIACPADVVFAYATDPTRFPEWQKDVVRVRLAAGPPSTVGSTFTTTRWVGRTERTMTQEITEVAPPWRWAARGVDGPIRPSASITVEELDGSTSRVTFTLDFDGRGIGVPLVPVVRRQARRAAPASYRNLKRRLESGATTG